MKLNFFLYCNNGIIFVTFNQHIKPTLNNYYGEQQQ